MHRVRRAIPSLTALVAFEAAARCESFTRAAAELGVSQAAVSRRIRTLETDLGVALFLRAHRRVRLTEPGETLFLAVTDGFDRVAAAVEELQAGQVHLTVSVSVAFGHFRLLPMLSAFRASALGVRVRVISEDDWRAPHDRMIDIAIRYGRPPFRGMAIVGSLPETVVPVAAPEVAAALPHPSIAGLASQAEVALIESDAPEPSWLDWSGWLSRSGWSGHHSAALLKFSSYSDAVYAAMDGQGVALGWTGLLARALGDGRLVALDLPAMVPVERHYILIPERARRTANSDAFVSWIEEAIRSGRRP